MTAGARLPVTVLTGFLGSGKTTVLARLIRRPEFQKTAVIMNEFGDVALDHHLIETSDEGLLTLSTGCLCCAAQGDLARAIKDLMGRRRAGLIAFDRFVVETTGIANPGPIVQTLLLDPALAETTYLAHIVTTVDSLTGPETLDARIEARRQAAIADVLILTKSDLAGAAATAALAGRTAALNPSAEQIVAVMGDVAPAVFLPAPGVVGPERGQAHDHEHDHEHSHDHDHGGIGSISVRRLKPIRAAALPVFLEALAEAYGPKLLRVKGLAAIAEAPERPAVIHGVQHVFHAIEWLDRWPDADRTTRLTLIGENLTPGWPEILLDALDEEAGAASG